MRKLVSGLMVLLVGCAIGACGSDDDGDATGGVEARLCAKADECNLLIGQTAQDCTDEFKMCTATLTTAQRADWNQAIDACLQMQDCANVASCYQTVPGC